MKEILSCGERIKRIFLSTLCVSKKCEYPPLIILDIMLMCHKVTHKKLIDNSPLFRKNFKVEFHGSHTNCGFFCLISKDKFSNTLLTKAFALNIMYLYDKYIIEQRRGVVEIIISSNTSKPIYEQITSQIKAMIMSGELKTGDPIPSMRALAKSIHVSVITVQKRMKICKGTVLLKQR